jgi:hypothetical protein
MPLFIDNLYRGTACPHKSLSLYFFEGRGRGALKAVRQAYSLNEFT